MRVLHWARDWPTEWASLVELRAELDSLEFELETEAGERERDELQAPSAECVWCGAVLRGSYGDLASWAVTFPADEYRGPLRFDESDPDRWRVAVFVGGAWRWLSLFPPEAPGAPYTMFQPACPTGCYEAFMQALRRTAIEGRMP